MRSKSIFIVISICLLSSTISAQSHMVDSIDKTELSYEDQYYKLLKVLSNKSKGFNYDYYLRIPKDVNIEKEIYLLVCSTATGKPNDDINYHDSRVRNTCRNGWEAGVASKLGVPLLIPVFERAKSNGKSKYYTHVLDRDVMTIKNRKDNKARLDLQLLAMINDARIILNDQGFVVKNKILLSGFSASGFFANRFTFMHPDVVEAVAVGGIAGMPMLPLSIYEGKKMPYPMGVYDFRKITGEEFDENGYKMIPQMIFMGELDDNDMFKVSDNPEDQCVYQVNRQFGKEVHKRWIKSREILGEVAPNIQTITYLGIAHTVNQGVINDIVSFFELNKDQSFKRIIPSLLFE